MYDKCLRFLLETCALCLILLIQINYMGYEHCLIKSTFDNKYVVKAGQIYRQNFIFLLKILIFQTSESLEFAVQLILPVLTTLFDASTWYRLLQIHMRTFIVNQVVLANMCTVRTFVYGEVFKGHANNFCLLQSSVSCYSILFNKYQIMSASIVFVKY